jgi:hypothetical protein
MRTGKIALLPDNIREDVNHRLHDGERGKLILGWLNSLSQVKAVLAKHFKGRPITPSNLTEWKQGGYIDWQVRQDALTLVSNLNDKQALGDDALPGKLNDSLLRWLSIQYAAAAQAFITVESNPELKWNRLRQLCSDVTRLRRGDFSAERIVIQQKRLSLDEKTAEQKLEDKFWDWTRRPEIAEKLWPPHKYPGGISPEHLEIIDSYLMEGWSPLAHKYALNAKTWGAFANKPPKGWQPPPPDAPSDNTPQTSDPPAGAPNPPPSIVTDSPLGAPASLPAGSENSGASESSPTPPKF